MTTKTKRVITIPIPNFKNLKQSIYFLCVTLACSYEDSYYETDCYFNGNPEIILKTGELLEIKYDDYDKERGFLISDFDSSYIIKLVYFLDNLQKKNLIDHIILSHIDLRKPYTDIQESLIAVLNKQFESTDKKYILDIISEYYPGDEIKLMKQ